MSLDNQKKPEVKLEPGSPRVTRVKVSEMAQYGNSPHLLVKIVDAITILVFSPSGSLTGEEKAFAKSTISEWFLLFSAEGVNYYIPYYYYARKQFFYWISDFQDSFQVDRNQVKEEVTVDKKAIKGFLTRETKPAASVTPNRLLALVDIPYNSLVAISAIFMEGENRPEYGRFNWKEGANDKAYQRKRNANAIRHLMLWSNGDRGEDHLAKVAWFCITQLELERIEKLAPEIDSNQLSLDLD